MNQRILLVGPQSETAALLRETRRLDILVAARDEVETLELGNVHVAVLAGVDGGPSDFALCARVVERAPDVPVILLAASGNMRAAIGAMRAGAYDVLSLPTDRDTLGFAIDRAAREHALRLEVRRLRLVVDPGECFEGMIGTSPPMMRLFSLISRVAETDATTLAVGESGVGKELVAKAIHARSSRHSGPFVPINCAALPEPLLESELFGHVKGAFTDARVARQGLFAKAAKGTLFLDEIAEMPFGMQAKLLRALQERVVRPVGGDEEVPFDARLVAATSRDLDVEVQAGRFRADLRYRIDVVRLDVPPLRARPTDIMLLAKSFLLRTHIGRADPVVGFRNAAIDSLVGYSWPGNVRQLQNCVARAAAVAAFDHIGVEDLPERALAEKLVVDTGDPAELVSMAEVQRRYIVAVIAACAGNRTRAARVLGFDRRTLYRKLERAGIMPSSAPPPGAWSPELGASHADSGGTLHGSRAAAPEP